MKEIVNNRVTSCDIYKKPIPVSAPLLERFPDSRQPALKSVNWTGNVNPRLNVAIMDVDMSVCNLRSYVCKTACLSYSLMF